MLEDHFAVLQGRKVGVDLFEAGDAVDEGGGSDEVCALNEFESWLFKDKASSVEGAGLMRDQNDAFEAVYFGEELEFVNHALFFDVGFFVAG